MGDYGQSSLAKRRDEPNVSFENAKPPDLQMVNGAEPSRTARSGRFSPPPHIVGQIVEMGFSPFQARQALEKTSTGVDVAAALESLLSANGHGSDADDDQIEHERVVREDAERERRRRRKQGPFRESIKPRDVDGIPDGEQTSEADKILAQATEIGQNVLSKATSFWNSSKEKAMKVYEEQRKAMEAGENGARKGRVPRDGRPRWMQDVEEGVDVRNDPEPEAGIGFKDGDDDNPPQRRVDGTSNGHVVSSTTQPISRQVGGEARYRSAKERADLLFADESTSYVPPARHRKSTPNSTARAVSPKPSTAPLPTRQLVGATPSQLSTSAKYKAKGNELFKLGQFAEAESSYSSAIAALPEGHLTLLPLHNNRAATQLKLGQSASAACNCTTVINLIGPAYHPSKEEPLPSDVASEVKLGEALVKATIKRAQAWEMGEKWNSAVEDWERVMAFDGILLGSTAAVTHNLAADGARRSKRMLEGGIRSTAKPKAVTPPASVKPVDVMKSQAVTELRKANRVIDAEDEQRIALKDTVDIKLASWKSGKETNLRALIASLDTVLWDEILSGGLKVGMHEIITEKQVKIKYMKVIARLHPDKVGSRSYTSEQKLIAIA